MNKIIQSWPSPIIRDHRIFENHNDIKELAVASTEHIDDFNKFIPGKPIIDNKILYNLKSWILNTVYINAKEINAGLWDKDYTPSFINMWAWSSSNYNNPLHSHPNTSWGGVYCLDPGESDPATRNGTTVLYSPLPWGTYFDPGVAFIEKQCTQTHDLAAGDLLLFPFYIKHTAKYVGTVPRTIIAFNITF